MNESWVPLLATIGTWLLFLAGIAIMIRSHRKIGTAYNKQSLRMLIVVFRTGLFVVALAFVLIQWQPWN